MNAGDKHYQAESKLTLKMFASKPQTYDSFSFFGTQITTTQIGRFASQQAHYICALREVPNNADIYIFRHARAFLAQVLHSRPDYSFIVNNAAHMTKKTLSEKNIANLNKAN